MKFIFKFLSATLLFFGITFQAFGNVGFNASLLPDIAIHPRTTRIDGFTISVYGENETHGFKLGIVNGATGNSEGGSVGFVNYADNFIGAQVGLVNFTRGSIKGFQWAAFNYAENMHGLQLGFVNFTRHATSLLQIGFINIISDNQVFFADFPKALAPAFVIVNWRFP